jgi:hypothetical protein
MSGFTTLLGRQCFLQKPPVFLKDYISQEVQPAGNRHLDHSCSLMDTGGPNVDYQQAVLLVKCNP